MESVYNVYVAGESGSGKTEIVQGLINAGSGVFGVPQNTENGEEFWDHQGIGESGNVNYEKNGNKAKMDIQEAQSYRSRMGNTLLAYDATQKADLVIFCADNANRSYGFSRVLGHLSTSLKAKMIIAVNKADAETITLSEKFDLFPRFNLNASANYGQLLDLAVEVLLHGETVKAIRAQQLKLKAEKDAAIAAATPQVAKMVKKPSEPKISIKKKKNASNSVTKSSVKSLNAAKPSEPVKKGLVNSMISLFSNRNKVETSDVEVPPLA
jgi:hypothetical protein